MEATKIYENKDHIKAKLNSIFISKFKIDFEREYKDLLDEHLMGMTMRFTPRDLLCLFNYVEKGFNIEIPEKCVVDGNFSSFNKILAIIYEQIN